MSGRGVEPPYFLAGEFAVVTVAKITRSRRKEEEEIRENEGKK